MIKTSNKIATPIFFINPEERPKHTEGALWDADKNVLFGVDVNGKKVFAYNPLSEKIDFYDVPEDVGTVVPTKTGKLLVALQSGIGVINLETEAFTWKLRFNKNPTLRSNDGKCSPEGRFWFGTMGYNPNIQQKEGSLYRLDKNYSLTTILNRKVTISNGVLWNIRGDVMYYIDTPTNEVVAYHYDQTTGEISNKKTIIVSGEVSGYFDGATIDEEDKLWIALWGGGGVGRYDPVSGKLIFFVKVPDAYQVSSCSFGGSNLNELYITTSREGLKSEDFNMQSMAGAVFRIKLPFKGISSNKFG